MNEMVKVPMASGGTLFTRGGLDAPDNRGESMVCSRRALTMQL